MSLIDYKQSYAVARTATNVFRSTGSHDLWFRPDAGNAWRQFEESFFRSLTNLILDPEGTAANRKWLDKAREQRPDGPKIGGERLGAPMRRFEPWIRDGIR